jgi:hypothetical protein
VPYRPDRLPPEAIGRWDTVSLRGRAHRIVLYHHAARAVGEHVPGRRPEQPLLTLRVLSQEVDQVRAALLLLHPSIQPKPTGDLEHVDGLHGGVWTDHFAARAMASLSTLVPRIGTRAER